MKVLHVYRTYYPETQGGLEETIRQICRGTHELGATSRVLALASQSSTTRIDEAEVWFEKMNFEIASCGVSFRAIGRHRKLVDWADVVNYHFPWPYSDVLYFLGHHFQDRSSKPAVATYHSDIVRQRFLGHLYRPLMYRFLGEMDRLVCTSPNYFATSDVLGRLSERVEVIPIGIDEASYPAAEQNTLDKWQARLGNDFFLFVGVLRYYKGLYILLEAIKGTRLQVVIAGSGPTEEELKQQAIDLDLTNVTFLGYVSDSDKCALFELSKAVVFPSYLRAEAFGITLLEGSMFGKPLISTEVGSGTSHVNVHEESGLVVAPGHAGELRAAMETIDNDDALAKKLGSGARKRFEAMFTGRLMSERYSRLYHELLCESSARSQ